MLTKDRHGVKNVKYPAIEVATNLRSIVADWNIKTATWLKYYIYTRLVPQGEKPRFWHLIVTYLFSAAWHGLNPGYYLCFGSAALGAAVERKIAQHITPRINTTGVVHALYSALCWVCTQATINYIVTPMILLDLKAGWGAWRNLYFVGHAAMLLVWCLAPLLGSTKMPRKKTE